MGYMKNKLVRHLPPCLEVSRLKITRLLMRSPMIVRCIVEISSPNYEKYTFFNDKKRNLVRVNVSY